MRVFALLCIPTIPLVTCFCVFCAFFAALVLHLFALFMPFFCVIRTNFSVHHNSTVGNIFWQ